MPACTAAAAAWSSDSNAACLVTSCVMAPPSVQMIPSSPHSFTVMEINIGLTAMGMPFHALYEAITAFAPPSRNAMRKGTE